MNNLSKDEALNTAKSIQFDQGMPFFDMVGTFLAAVSAVPAIFNDGNPMNFGKSQFISINGIQCNGKHILPFEIYEQAQLGYISKESYTRNCCIMLANTAYESVRKSKTNSAEFEFFRHVRNASSHNNRFNFDDEEPRRIAKWRRIILDNKQKGKKNPHYGTECFGFLLGPADLIDLLKDIENQLSQRKNPTK